jgi:hypothetical protein
MMSCAAGMQTFIDGRTAEQTGLSEFIECAVSRSVEQVVNHRAVCEEAIGEQKDRYPEQHRPAVEYKRAPYDNHAADLGRAEQAHIP